MAPQRRAAANMGSAILQIVENRKSPVPQWTLVYEVRKKLGQQLTEFVIMTEVKRLVDDNKIRQAAYGDTTGYVVRDWEAPETPETPPDDEIDCGFAAPESPESPSAPDQPPPQASTEPTPEATAPQKPARRVTGADTMRDRIGAALSSLMSLAEDVADLDNIALELANERRLRAEAEAMWETTARELERAKADLANEQRLRSEAEGRLFQVQANAKKLAAVVAELQTLPVAA